MTTGTRSGHNDTDRQKSNRSRRGGGTTYQVIWELEWEERHEFSRSVVPGGIGIAREIPRFDHVGIVLIKDSMVSVSQIESESIRIPHMSIPLVA